MTFVIKNHLETMDNDELDSSPFLGRGFVGRKKDVEAYNYLLNKNTWFMTGGRLSQEKVSRAGIVAPKLREDRPCLS